MIVLYRYFARILHGWFIWWMIAFALTIRKQGLLRSWLGSEAAEVQRARYAIHAFIGENGSGKTNLMMRQALRALKRGQTVISTVPIYSDKAAGVLHPNYVAFDSWKVLKDARNCVIVMDEMTGVANARDTAALPAEIQLILNQLRKRKIKVYWSSPAWEDAQVQIRRVTRAVTLCVGSWSDKAAYRSASEENSDEFDEAWIPNRLFHAQTYRKGITSDFKLARHQEPDVEEWYWGPGSESFDAYDTNEETTRLQEAGDAGQCLECFGSRRRDECICEAYTAKKAERAALRKPDEERAPRGGRRSRRMEPAGSYPEPPAWHGASVHEHAHAGH